jgi:hypothetical protein
MVNGEDSTIVVGLLADPSLPADIARDLAQDLPEQLSEQLSGRVCWKVEVTLEAFEVAPSSERIIDKARQRVHGTKWDIAIAITDVPIQTGNGAIVAQLGCADRVALISLPALGGIGLRRRARKVAVTIVAELVPGLVDLDAERPPQALSARLARKATPRDDDIDVEMLMGRSPGVMRLLAGMVRANRPWQLALGLSTALAGAATGSAFGILYSTIWSFADAIGPPRMVAATLLAVGMLTVWLIAGHGLWERKARPLGRLFNAATVLTVVSGVLVFYAALLAINLTAAAVMIPPHYLSQQLGHPAGLLEYARVALMATVLGMVAGAVGSGLENRATVRAAAYRSRQQQRRAQLTD